MSQYKTSNPFQRGIEQIYPTSNNPLLITPAHSLQSNFIPSLNPVALARDGLSADYNICPTKRIRYTQHNFAERNVNMEEIPVLMPNAHDVRLSKNHHDLAKNYKDARIHTSHRQWGDMEEAKYMKMYQDQREPSLDRIHKYYNFDEGLTIPPLMVESKARSVPELQQMLNNKKPTQQMIDNFRYLNMLEQLAQQRAQYAMQQERLEFFLNQQQFSQERKAKLAEDFYRLNQTPSSGSEIQESSSHKSVQYFGLNDQRLPHQTQAQIQVNKSNKKLKLKPGFPKKVLVSETKSEEGKICTKVEADELMDDTEGFVRFEDLNDQFYEKLDIQGEKAIEKKEKKKASLPQSSSHKEKKRANQRYSFDFFGKNTKNSLLNQDGAPRKKNTWQLKAQEVQEAQGPQVITALEEEQKTSPPLNDDVPSELNINIAPENEQIRQKGVKAKPPKPVDIPQHMQDDSMIDFNSLLSQTLTNNQNNTPSQNGQSSGFVVISKNFKTGEMGEVGEETKIGDQYQVLIPEMTKKRLKNKKRNPELMWKPEVFREGELKGYLDDLCEILKCEAINEERALKLLKRKKFKKEKVKINISKNEKFYASFLVVGNQTEEAVEAAEAAAEKIF